MKRLLSCVVLLMCGMPVVAQSEVDLGTFWVRFSNQPVSEWNVTPITVSVMIENANSAPLHGAIRLSFMQSSTRYVLTLFNYDHFTLHNLRTGLGTYFKQAAIARNDPNNLLPSITHVDAVALWLWQGDWFYGSKATVIDMTFNASEGDPELILSFVPVSAARERWVTFGPQALYLDKEAVTTLRALLAPAKVKKALKEGEKRRKTG